MSPFLSLPKVPATLQIVRRVLHETGHDVLSGRRHIGIDHGRKDHVEIRAFGDLPVLGIVVGALDVIDARADGHGAPMQDRGRALSPGMAAPKLGNSLRAMLTLPDEPRVRKFWIDVTNSSGKCFASTNCRKVRFGSAADMTTFAWSSSPFSSQRPQHVHF